MMNKNHNKRVSLIAVLSLLLVAALAACTPKDDSGLGEPGAPEPTETPAAPEGEAPDTETNLSGSRWNLVSLNGEPLIDGSTISLDFLNGDLGGSASCNSYSAPYTLEGTVLAVGDPVSTMMACEGVMDQEALYLEMLRSAESLTVGENELTLHTPEGDLVYEPAGDASLEGTTWTLSGIVENEAVVSTAVDAEITATFDNGQLGGFGGCNSYSAEYTIEGEVLNLGDVVSTLMACEEEERTEREQAYLAALQQAAAYQTERDRLAILDANGNALLHFTAQNAGS